MKLFGALVCAATVVCVTTSPQSYGSAVLRAASCSFSPSCDSTGEEKVAIPCEGYCTSYCLCKDGVYTVKDCDGRKNFNNVLRKCDSGFNDCDWWKLKTTPHPNNQASSSSETESTTISNSNTSPGTEIPTSPPTTEGPCHANANCDATGEEKKPIPCANFCNRYYQCKDGFYTVEKCENGNFDYEERICSTKFKYCDWYKQTSTITTTTPSSSSKPSPSTQAPKSTSSTASTTPAGAISSTTQKSRADCSVLKPTISLLFTIIIPLLTRYL